MASLIFINSSYSIPLFLAKTKWSASFPCGFPVYENQPEIVRKSLMSVIKDINKV